MEKSSIQRLFDDAEQLICSIHDDGSGDVDDVKFSVLINIIKLHGLDNSNLTFDMLFGNEFLSQLKKWASTGLISKAVMERAKTTYYKIITDLSRSFTFQSHISNQASHNKQPVKQNLPSSSTVPSDFKELHLAEFADRGTSTEDSRVVWKLLSTGAILPQNLDGNYFQLWLDRSFQNQFKAEGACQLLVQSTRSLSNNTEKRFKCRNANCSTKFLISRSSDYNETPWDVRWNQCLHSNDKQSERDDANALHDTLSTVKSMLYELLTEDPGVLFIEAFQKICLTLDLHMKELQEIKERARDHFKYLKKSQRKKKPNQEVCLFPAKYFWLLCCLSLRCQLCFCFFSLRLLHGFDPYHWEMFMESLVRRFYIPSIIFFYVNLYEK
jgi:hypothetical protein